MFDNKVVLMNKLDGASCLLKIDIQNGTMTLFSKGDGETNTHVIDHILKFSKNFNQKNIIEKCKEVFKKNNQVYFRGEIIIPKSVY